MRLTFISSILIIVTFTSCVRDPELDVEEAYSLPIPIGFPPPEIPDDNPFTSEKIALGKKLFYDETLSVDSTISCASCHKLENGFADHLSISPGVEGRIGFRNAPTLANVAWLPFVTMDGGNPALETQPYIPIESHEEMGFNMALLSYRLQADPEYADAFKQIFGKVPDPFGITRALAAFERTIISGNSRFDQYFYQGDPEVLTAEEKNGMNIFFSAEAGCGNCHGGFLFTNGTLQNNGFFADYNDDTGRERITHQQEDVGKFKVPTLRNIGVTGPYMHNGQITTLDEIINRYMSGGSGHENQSDLIKPFTLTPEEKNDLIAFLHALTDTNFLQNGSLYEE